MEEEKSERAKLVASWSERATFQKIEAESHQSQSILASAFVYVKSASALVPANARALAGQS